MEKGGLASRKQVQAFWSQSRADLATAITLMDAGVYYASVFFSQQTAEKALKAAVLRHTNKFPKGHNLIQMADSIEAPLDVMNAAAELNADFLTTRNPELVDGVPAQMYDKKSARSHLKAAKLILEWVKSTI